MSATISSTGITYSDSTSQTNAGSSSLSTAGYHKMPSGMIVQWGSGTASVGSTITFPISFSTTSYTVSPSIAGYTGTAALGADILCVTNTSAAQAKVGNYAGFQGITFRWIAIGY